MLPWPQGVATSHLEAHGGGTVWRSEPHGARCTSPCCMGRRRLPCHLTRRVLPNSPISVYRRGEIPIQSRGQSVSAPRGTAGARLKAHTELRTMRQRSAREAMYRNRSIQLTVMENVANDVLHLLWRQRPCRASSSPPRRYAGTGKRGGGGERISVRWQSRETSRTLENRERRKYNVVDKAGAQC